jgi:hypothetical protein
MDEYRTEKCTLCNLYKIPIEDKPGNFFCYCTIQSKISELESVVSCRLNCDLAELSIDLTSLAKLTWKLAQYQKIATNPKGDPRSAAEIEDVKKLIEKAKKANSVDIDTIPGNLPEDCKEC